MYPPLSHRVLILSQFSVSNGCLPPLTYFLLRKQVSSQGLGMVALQHRSGHVHMPFSRLSCLLIRKITADLNITPTSVFWGLNSLSLFLLNFPFWVPKKILCNLLASGFFRRLTRFSTNFFTRSPHFSHCSTHLGKGWLFPVV